MCGKATMRVAPHLSFKGTLVDSGALVIGNSITALLVGSKVETARVTIAAPLELKLIELSGEACFSGELLIKASIGRLSLPASLTVGL